MDKHRGQGLIDPHPLKLNFFQNFNFERISLKSGETFEWVEKFAQKMVSTIADW
ncbi:hypothetical protein PL9214380003 [Planktothrix tepida PCC 9214]|uniref:Uncharacterized protein n=1 Tax=Planktothrix tepida PCC 9214 TaxID=671072 RepID=A0A1J1LH87_9CYAN|nr:hypothetical protein PL9214380003 [Planktothrix tepida PCC 9214]